MSGKNPGVHANPSPRQPNFSFMIQNHYVQAALIAVIVLFTGFFVLKGVFTSSENSNAYSPGYSSPVEFDFDQIQERGVIRLATRYSSASYFLHHGLERGFEFEFFSEFAQQHGLRVEVVIPTENMDPIELLNLGQADVIAQNFAITPGRVRYIEFSEPYNLVDQVVVLPYQLEDKITSLDSLAGITVTVRRGSSYYYSLLGLQEAGIDVIIDTVPEFTDTEALILAVAEGEIQATIADDNLFRASSIYITGVVEGPRITSRDLIAWGIRRNAPMLKDAVDEFITSHFRISEIDGLPRRSALLNILRERYFEDERMVHRFRAPIPVTQYSGLLSPYDALVQPIAEEMDVDWKLVIAIMAQESRFNPNAVSWAGAVGLMQVIPRFSLITEEELFDEEANIREGIRILREHLDHYSYLDSTNQISLALATYNAGMGHVADARRIAIDMNRDPNEWANVERGLLMLMNRQHYMNARHGFARGIETSNYVRDVMNRYRMYNTIVSLANEQHHSPTRWTMSLSSILSGRRNNSPQP
jgi:membrane-bound lytic murein transglycosylase F